MVRREHIINKLRELDYRFKRDAWRVQLWKKGTHVVCVPKKDFLEDEWVRSTFRQCQLTPEETAEFLRLCQN